MTAVRRLWLIAAVLALAGCSYEPAAPSPVPVAVAPTPEPTLSAELGTAIEGGIASWFNSYGPGLYAAVPSYTFGDARYNITVCRQDDGSRCVVVVVLDHCACPGDRIVDLSRDAFARLEDPSRGLVAVTVMTGGVSPTPPQTHAEGDRP